jgi:voltage-gated potassium channel
VTVDDTGDRLVAFEARIARPRQVLAVLWLPVLVGARLDASAVVGVALDIASTAIWVFFVLEYLWRIRLAADRRAYVSSHLFDIVALVLPPLRALWGLTAFRAVVGRPGLAVFLLSMLAVLFAAAGLVFAIERDVRGANIDSFGDAVWWAFVTATTVGYGDHTPVSGLGRSVAGGLVLVGVVLYSVVTAHITAYVLERSRLERESELLCELRAAADRLERVADELAAARTAEPAQNADADTAAADHRPGASDDPAPRPGPIPDRGRG